MWGFYLFVFFGMGGKGAGGGVEKGGGVLMRGGGWMHIAAGWGVGLTQVGGMVVRYWLVQHIMWKFGTVAVVLG